MVLRGGKIDAARAQVSLPLLVALIPMIHMFPDRPLTLFILNQLLIFGKTKILEWQVCYQSINSVSPPPVVSVVPVLSAYAARTE